VKLADFTQSLYLLLQSGNQTRREAAALLTETGNRSGFLFGVTLDGSRFVRTQSVVNQQDYYRADHRNEYAVEIQARNW
jgi:hypothetical protein